MSSQISNVNPLQAITPPHTQAPTQAPAPSVPPAHTPPELESDQLTLADTTRVASKPRLISLTNDPEKLQMAKKGLGGGMVVAGLVSGIGYLGSIPAQAAAPKVALGLAAAIAVPAAGIAIAQDKSAPEVIKASAEAFVGIGGVIAGVTLLNSIPAVNAPPAKVALGLGMAIGGPLLAFASNQLIEVRGE